MSSLFGLSVVETVIVPENEIWIIGPKSQRKAIDAAMAEVFRLGPAGGMLVCPGMLLKINNLMNDSGGRK
jgi:hypothetical protein